MGGDRRDWRSGRALWDAPQNRLSREITALRASGERLIDLTISNPEECGEWHDRDELAAIAATAARERYRPDPRGLRRAREALAESLGGPGDSVDPEDLILCASTSEAYSWLLRLTCDAGDRLLVPTPSYPLLDALAALDQVALDHVPMHADGRRWHLGSGDLAQALAPQTRALAVVHPNNPTGYLLSSEEIDSLLQISLPRGLPVISDEVFLDYVLEGGREPSIAAREQGIIFSLGGLSKSLALPHWKLAWIRIGGDPALRPAVRSAVEWIADSFLSVNTISMAALPELLEMGPAVRERIRARLLQNVELVHSRLEGVEGVEVWKPRGGWSITVRFPAIISDEELALRLVSGHNVLVQPGYFYEMPWDGSFVLSLLTPPELMDEGLGAIAQELERLKG